jgi:hypothetical protein
MSSNIIITWQWLANQLMSYKILSLSLVVSFGVCNIQAGTQVKLISSSTFPQAKSNFKCLYHNKSWEIHRRHATESHYCIIPICIA